MQALSRRPAPPSTLYLGTVEKVTGATATVIVPDLAGPTFALGPAAYPDHLTATAAVPLAAGNRVLVGILANPTDTRDSVVILARLA